MLNKGFIRFSGKETVVGEPLIKGIKNSFTYEFWVKPLVEHKNSIQTFLRTPGLRGQNYVIGPGHGGLNHVAGAGVSVGTNGVTVFEHTNNYLPATLVYKREIHDWTHVAVVYKNKVPFLFINGKLVKRGLKSIKSEVYASGVFGGLEPYGYFNGYLGEIRIWDHPRKQSQIRKNMYKNLTGSERGLYGCWNLKEDDFNIWTRNSYNIGLKKVQEKEKVEVEENPIIKNIIDISTPRIKKINNKDIDVIVCVHNALNDVKECLESLIAKETVPFNLIVIDDGSDQQTEKFLKSFANKYSVQLIRNKHAVGYTKAANQGLKLSKANYCVLLNSDTIVTLRWLEKLIQCIETESKVGIIGPVSNAASWQSVPEVIENNDWATNLLNLTVEEQSRVVEKASLKSYPEVSFLNGFCLMIKREVINTIGYFDQDTFAKGYGEENDYCLRAVGAGFKLKVSDDCFIYHKKSKSYTINKRKILKTYANQLLMKKYSIDEIRMGTQALKSNEHLSLLRSNMKKELNKIPKNHDPSILFILPVKSGGGGVHSVIQETIGLQGLNINAKVATKEKLKKDYYDNYPEATKYLMFYSDENELLRISQHFDIVVATIFSSVKILKKIIDKIPHIKPAYYIQDYEPWFFKENQLNHIEAQKSYELIPNIHAFAKTDWICDMVKKNHGLEVHKIKPSLDQSLFNPHYKKSKSNQIRITAMIRPKTPRRSPKETMQVLKEIKEKYGNKVKISVFGCSNYELKSLGIGTNFIFNNYGILKRHQVASLFKETDIFIDLSTYQAFGRTGLEAMSVGCCVILPDIGGINEYAVHNENSFLVNIQQKDQVIKYLSLLIEDPSIQTKFSRNAIKTASSYSIEAAAKSEAEFFLGIVQK
ncbi:glycosyltransferase [Alkalihalobacillus sp. BA299]|uniref:glycosyltransferase n=1 Tax=Alkalihalobacillus sp. BA299 TaxID=2815938 RepID=UPI001ADCCFA6|nr:glycosyltransferase [Alkalihalobacillus sp. BA299]